MRDTIKKLTRSEGGAVVDVEDYDYNALGALKLNAGVALDHQRPRLDGAGLADAAVPATLGGQPVVLDTGGRITSLKGTTRAAVPLAAFQSLYAVEDTARIMDTAARRDERQRRSKPVYEELVRWSELHRPMEPPSSLFGKAVGYLLNHRLALQTSPGASGHSWESKEAATSNRATTATGRRAFFAVCAACNEWTRRGRRSTRPQVSFGRSGAEANSKKTTTKCCQRSISCEVWSTRPEARARHPSSASTRP